MTTRKFHFTRRKALGLAGTGALLGFVAFSSGSPVSAKGFPVRRSEAEWRRRLTRQQFYILREAGTELPHSSPLNDEKRKGTYHCRGCNNAVFSSTAKYESGTGWPSFWKPIRGAVGTEADYRLVVPRTDNNEAIEAGLRARVGSAVTHEFNFGGNINWQTNRNAFDFRYGPGFAGFATNLYDTPQVALPSSTLVGGDLDDPFPIARSKLVSGFVSDTVGLFDERLLVTGGLRIQSIRQDSFNYYNGGQLDSTYEEDAVTPVAGIVAKPFAGLSLYANRIEALQQGPTAPLDPTLVSNPGETLGPRKSTQYEIGGKLALGDMFLTLAGYRISRPGEGVLPSGRFGYLGEQRHQGLEFTANGTVAPGLRFIGGVSLADAELDGSGEVPGVPEFTANADVEWDLPFAPGLTLTARAVHTGEQWVDAANTLRLDAWTRFDLGARYVLAAGEVPVTLRLTVDNIANEAYWASAFDSFSAALLQGRPCTVKASISADF